MIERYFIVSPESRLAKDFWAYVEDFDKIKVAFNDLRKHFEIETDKFYPRSNKCLYIWPTENDIAKYEKQMTKPTQNGGRSFKQKSAIQKYWTALTKFHGTNVIDKPFAPMYVDRGCFGKMSSRLFAIDDVVYCSISLEHDDIEVPKDWIEIKASQFFKVIEDYEERMSKNNETTN